MQERLEVCTTEEQDSDYLLGVGRKRKYTEIQEQKSAGGKNFYKQKKNARRSSWART